MSSEFSITYDLTEIESTAKKIKEILQKESAFCVWLKAPLGGGKTTIVRAMMHQFGLQKNIPVLSPTFTYVQEYKIGSEWFAHFDLYRFGEEGVHVDEMGIIDDQKKFRGIFVEWPERIKTTAILAPTHEIELIVKDQNKRRIQCRNLR